MFEELNENDKQKNSWDEKWQQMQLNLKLDSMLTGVKKVPIL